jgi:hypothetical protein
MEEALSTLRDLWNKVAALNHTPKLHSILISIETDEVACWNW